jgi:hypothetical protein
MKIHKKKPAQEEQGEGEDETLECRDCGAEFVFSAGEQAFYKEKGFDNKPTRCAECKAAKKARFDGDGGGGGGGRGGRGGGFGRGGRGGTSIPPFSPSFTAPSPSFTRLPCLLLPCIFRSPDELDNPSLIFAVSTRRPRWRRPRRRTRGPRRRRRRRRRRGVLRLPEGRVHARRLVPLLPLVIPPPAGRPSRCVDSPLRSPLDLPGAAAAAPPPLQSSPRPRRPGGPRPPPGIFRAHAADGA